MSYTTLATALPAWRRLLRNQQLQSQLLIATHSAVRICAQCAPGQSQIIYVLVLMLTAAACRARGLRRPAPSPDAVYDCAPDYKYARRVARRARQK